MADLIVLVEAMRAVAYSKPISTAEPTPNPPCGGGTLSQRRRGNSAGSPNLG
jgi:hypothetical protein